MKRIALFVSVAAVVGVLCGFLLGRAFPPRRSDSTDSFATSLDRVAVIQFSLAMLEQQRTAKLESMLQDRLASALQGSRRTIEAQGLPRPMPVIPNLTECVKRAGLYLQARNIHPEAVRDAEWVLAQLKRGSVS